MENDKYLDLGKSFYEWYKNKKLTLTVNAYNLSLEAEIKRVTELIAYVEEKRRLKGQCTNSFL